MDIKKIFTLETTVQEHLIAKLIQENNKNLRTIRDLELTLKVPRMHYKFIEEHGIHSFVQQCQAIVEREVLREDHH